MTPYHGYDLLSGAGNNRYSLTNTLGRASGKSVMSNVSAIRKRNFLRFGRSKICFLVVNTGVSYYMVVDTGFFF